MSESKKKTGNKKSSFLVQGSILAAASLISRLIGLLYRIPMTDIIGDDGNNYYGAAYDIYNVFLMISSFSLPLAVSKLVAVRAANHERKNVLRILKGALLFALIAGGISFLVVFGFADLLTALFQTPQSYLALRVLGPTLLIVAIMGVIRGFFMGMGTTVPSAISQIVEQVINAVVSVAAAYALFQYGSQVGKLLGNEKTYAEAYGAAGGTLGTSTGAGAGLIFLTVILVIFVGKYRRKKDTSHAQTESYASIMKVLVLTIIPVLVSTTVFNSANVIEHVIFKNIATMQNYDAETISTWWGIFSGKYILLTNLPVSIAAALASSTVPSISQAFAKRDHELIKQRIRSGMRFIMVIIMPCAVGMAVLASPILQLLFSDDRLIGATMIQLGMLGIIFYAISTLSNAVLQGIDHMGTPVKNALIAQVLHAIFLVVLMLVFHMGIYAAVLSNVFFSFVMCVLNSRSISKFSGYRQEWKQTYILPAVSALVMGIAVFCAYHGLHLFLPNAVSTMISILVGVLVYAFVIVRIGGLTESELRNFPKGNTLVRMLKKLHIL